MDKHESPSRAAFLALLVEDVIAARERLTSAHTQTARRDVVRASLAAIEGMTWVAREHVRTVSSELDLLSHSADLALRETSYAVSDSGKLIEQVRWLPLTTAIRLVISQAELVNPAIAIDFAEAGWSKLREAIDIRNRITHPKPSQSLAISDNDLAVVEAGLFWLLAHPDYVMKGLNLAFAQHNDELREILKRLSSGDAEALAEYHAVLREIEAEG